MSDDATSKPSAPPSESAAASASPAAPAPDAPTVLVVDDEPGNLASIEKIFQKDGMRVLTADSARAALELLRTHRVEVVLTDLMMPAVSGLELLRAIKQVNPDVEVVMMTAYGTVETAVQAMREGAYDFVEKPLKRMTIVKTVRKAAERRTLVAENKALKHELDVLTGREIVGSSPALRRVLEIATQAAPSSATVLVLGESGTGKELLARYIHQKSARAHAPFVAVNCSAIPETILEAELFGHEKGAFTGAHTKREGRFAKAAGGTLFLDEIGELSPSVQVKLLRVLQEGEYEPIGGDTARADVRIVAATNKDLRAEIAAGRFREDLFYRLATVPVHVPPLRERAMDIPLLAERLLDASKKALGKDCDGFTSEAAACIAAYRWPGNVRELQNEILRMLALTDGPRLGADLLSPRVLRTPVGESQAADLSLLAGLEGGLKERMDQLEAQVVKEALIRHRWNKSKAAAELGLSRVGLRNKLERYGLEKK